MSRYRHATNRHLLGGAQAIVPDDYQHDDDDNYNENKEKDKANPSLFAGGAS